MPTCGLRDGAVSIAVSRHGVLCPFHPLCAPDAMPDAPAPTPMVRGRRQQVHHDSRFTAETSSALASSLLKVYNRIKPPPCVYLSRSRTETRTRARTRHNAPQGHQEQNVPRYLEFEATEANALSPLSSLPHPPLSHLHRVASTAHSSYHIQLITVLMVENPSRIPRGTNMARPMEANAAKIPMTTARRAAFFTRKARSSVAA